MLAEQKQVLFRRVWPQPDNTQSTNAKTTQRQQARTHPTQDQAQATQANGQQSTQQTLNNSSTVLTVIMPNEK